MLLVTSAATLKYHECPASIRSHAVPTSVPVHTHIRACERRYKALRLAGINWCDFMLDLGHLCGWTGLHNHMRTLMQLLLLQ